MQSRTVVRDVEHDDAEWTIYTDSGGTFSVALDSALGRRINGGLVDREITLDLNDRGKLNNFTIGVKVAPLCGCCGGEGMHEYRAYAGGRSPDDDDIECSNCAGDGRSWFVTSRRNSCTGYRTLMRGRS